MGNNIPIIMLSAKSDIEDKVLGLNSGANDYLAKPFSFDELIARIKVQLRDNDTCINTLMIDDLKLDCDRKQVIRGDNMIFLTQKEYMLLEYLLRHRGKILSKEILSEALWNMNDEIESNVLNVHIYQLRQKIDTKNKTKLIHTIRGMGYKIDV
jgi:DNA-binding response OmpR family regulator